MEQSCEIFPPPGLVEIVEELSTPIFELQYLILRRISDRVIRSAIPATQTFQPFLHFTL